LPPEGSVHSSWQASGEGIEEVDGGADGMREGRTDGVTEREGRADGATDGSREGRADGVTDGVREGAVLSWQEAWLVIKV
jgi:hypothetical protein